MNNLFKHSSLVITSIAAPNAAMKMYAEKCKALGADFIVIGDVSSPEKFELDGCRFFGIEEQKELPFKLARLLPEKHYARKNIGYLLSKEKDFIIETDDDNFPKDNFWNKSVDIKNARLVEEKGWVNAYRFFTEENIWPRGFPLEGIRNQETGIRNQGSGTKNQELEVKIIQGLADENPDVDAVYRMTMKLPVNFKKDLPIILGEGTWCPFNSQNTVWKKEAFPLLYLPSYSSFRMTDIWRSFIAQRIGWTCGWNILFHEADVWQERNAHNLLKDFEDEIPGYLHNITICKKLEELDLKSGVTNIAENIIRCYEMMVKEGFVGEKEMELVETWVDVFP
jgi:hypothetical protein